MEVWHTAQCSFKGMLFISGSNSEVCNAWTAESIHAELEMITSDADLMHLSCSGLIFLFWDTYTQTSLI